MKLASIPRGYANFRNQIKPSKQQMTTSKIGSGAQFALRKFLTAHVAHGSDSTEMKALADPAMSASPPVATKNYGAQVGRVGPMPLKK
jgi:hypothetical protein